MRDGPASGAGRTLMRTEMIAPDRADDRSGARRVAFVSLLWTAAIAGAKITVGVVSGSVAVLGDGFHSALDLAGTALTLGAVRIADKPPDREHPYGHGRAENLAALASSAVMLLVAAGVAWEAARRLAEARAFEAPTYAIAATRSMTAEEARAARFSARP